MEVVEHLVEREAVLRAERQDDRFLVGRRLKLEAEAATEALPERQPPRAIDAPAERSVDDQLHASRFVEEALEHHPGGGRNRAQRGLALAEIVAQLRGCRGREPDLILEPRGIATALPNHRDRGGK